MKKVSLFSSALAIIAGLSIAEANVSAAQRSNNNVNEIGSLVYSNTYGQDYVNDAQSVSVFKDSNGRYGIGQGTADSTAFFKINNDGTVTIWQLKDNPNTPTAKQGYNKKTVSIASLQKSENQTTAQKATINHAKSAINNTAATSQRNSSTATNATSASGTSKSASRQTLLQDQQVIDDLGNQAYRKYFGVDEQSAHLNFSKDKNGRYVIDQGTAESTMYYKINPDGKTMTVWTLDSKPNTTVANQQFTASTISLSSLGFNPAGQTSNAQGSANTQSTASSSASPSTATGSQHSTTQASAASQHSAVANTQQATADNKQVAQQANKKVTVSSATGRQALSYYQVAALVYAKTFGINHLYDQGLQLTMNQNHSRFILGEGSAATTLRFRVNQGKKTVTVWAPTGKDQKMTRNTYEISALVNEFANQDQLINQTAQSLK